MRDEFRRFSRREVLTTGAAAACVAIGENAVPAASRPRAALIRKKIPSTGEALPVIGLGTNAYGAVNGPEDLAARRAVLEQMHQLGGTVIDTARAYGESEVVIGGILADAALRDRYFLATKTPMAGDFKAGAALVEDSFRRLRTDRIDLVAIHSFAGFDELLPVLQEFRQSKRIRYVGVTTSRTEQHAQMVAALGEHRLDFVQVDYSLDNRAAAETVLPAAADRGVAVLVNMPFGGRRTPILPQLIERPLPEWAADIGATSWGQILLKYVISHPAVTCAIPGTTQLKHVLDNQGAGRGLLPDAAMRRRMEAYWDAR